MSDLSKPIFHDEEAARVYLEQQRWPQGPVCPFCGQFECVVTLKGKSYKPGWYHCKDCRKKFTVRVGTLYERSHVPLHKWLMATNLLCASKKGISAHQLHRMIGVTYKTAWFMFHRIREGMKDTSNTPLGGEGKQVEVDETFIGHKRERRIRVDSFSGKTNIERGTAHKWAIMSLVERGGRARSIHVDNLRKDTITRVLAQVHRKSRLQTDEAGHYWKIGREFEGGHGRVHHAMGTYSDGINHTNTIEGFFGIFKRGMRGVYQHCGEQHLHRYLAEYDFRYNHRTKLGYEDEDRTNAALKGIEGKRLTYRRIAPQPQAHD